jgi:hypothetical protein
MVRVIIEDTQPPGIVVEQMARIAGAVREPGTDHVTTLDDPHVDRLLRGGRSHQVHGRQRSGRTAADDHEPPGGVRHGASSPVSR